MNPRVADTDTIERINKSSVLRGKNRTLSSALLKKLDPDGVHICKMSFVHNDREMRTIWLFKLEGTMDPVEAALDMDFVQYKALAHVNELKLVGKE